MKSHILTLVLGSCLCGSVAALPVVPIEEQPLYWAVGYAWIDYTEEGVSEAASMGAISGRLGYRFSPMLDAELRYVKGVREDDLTVGVTVDVDQLYGIYGKVNVLTDVNFKPYVILGYTQGEVTGRAFGVSTSLEEAGYSWGVGVEFCRDDPVCVNAEYMSYLSQSNFELEAYTLGLRVNF